MALLLQGGGALGASQAEALAEAELQPGWLAGISIGAISTAIIACNHPDNRIQSLDAFWDQITARPAGNWADGWFGEVTQLSEIGHGAHGMLDRTSAFRAMKFNFGGRESIGCDPGPRDSENVFRCTPTC